MQQNLFFWLNKEIYMKIQASVAKMKLIQGPWTWPMKVMAWLRRQLFIVYHQRFTRWKITLVAPRSVSGFVRLEHLTTSPDQKEIWDVSSRKPVSHRNTWYPAQLRFVASDWITVGQEQTGPRVSETIGMEIPIITAIKHKFQCGWLIKNWNRFLLSTFP